MIAVMRLLLFLLLAMAADPRSQVLSTESRWVHAIDTRDAGKISAILAPGFVHVTYRGQLRRRNAELALVTRPKPYVQHTSAQTVDVLGTIAIVHGINDISQGGHIVLRLRYTDVYALLDGTWKAVSAQETAISP